MILIGGGVRSGKSALALRLARGLGERRVFLATAQPRDEEMRARIERHARERGAGFRTIEEPLLVREVLDRIDDADVVVIDCLTMWLSNMLLAGDSEPAILDRVDALIAAAQRASFETIVVTNEVGMGVHPESALGRQFRDIAGRAHQRLGASAREIYFAALGIILRLKPSPVVALDPVDPGESS